MKTTKKDLRIFGLIWGAIFTYISLYPMVFRGGGIRIWAAVVACAFILIILISPAGLKPFYKVWIIFGDFMGKIISKIILFLVFYLLVTPIALILKALGRDILNKKIDTNAESYWIKRAMQPNSMKKQF